MFGKVKQAATDAEAFVEKTERWRRKQNLRLRK